MNVLMVSERYLPIWGGAENQLAQLAPHLADGGTDVVIVTRRWKPDMARRENMNGVLVLRIGIPGSGVSATAIFSISLFFFLLREGRRFGVVHSHGSVKLGAMVAVASMFTGRPTVAKIATAGRIPRLQRTLPGRFVLALFGRVDAVICMSSEIRRELEAVALDPARIVRIENGVDSDRFAPQGESARTDWRRENRLAVDAVVAVFSGRLVRRKGIDTLVEAWSLIDPVGLGAHLFLLGSGADQPDSVELEVRGRVRDNATPNIVFVGDTASPEGYLNYADLFLFPSRREGFPNALLEAMSAGAAVIASNIGGCADLVHSGENGILVEPGDPRAFAEQLTFLLGENGTRARLGHAARRHVVEHNGLQQIAARYLALYETLAG